MTLNPKPETLNPQNPEPLNPKALNFAVIPEASKLILHYNSSRTCHPAALQIGKQNQQAAWTTETCSLVSSTSMLYKQRTICIAGLGS